MKRVFFRLHELCRRRVSLHSLLLVLQALTLRVSERRRLITRARQTRPSCSLMTRRLSRRWRRTNSLRISRGRLHPV